MAEKRDFGLTTHRITQYVITAAVMVLMFQAKDIYEEVKSTGKDVSAMSVNVAAHGVAISDLRMDFRELQKEVHTITSKPKNQ